MVRRNAWRLVLAVALVLGCSRLARLEAKDRELTLINIKYEGKIVWLPSPIVAVKGETVKLTLINNVPDDPNVHGFSIPDFDVRADVIRGEPMVATFKASKAGLFEFNCHLHPAHLRGQLLVMEK